MINLPNFPSFSNPTNNPIKNRSKTLCKKKGRFNIKTKRENMSQSDYLYALSEEFFGNNVVNKVTLAMFGIGDVPNIIVIVIIAIMMNSDITQNTKKTLCSLNKNSLQSILKNVDQKSLFDFITVLLCAIKYNLFNILQNSTNQKVKLIIQEMNESYAQITRSLLIDPMNNINNVAKTAFQSSYIINKGIIATIFIGFITKRFFYETYAGVKFDMEKLNTMMTTPRDISQSLLFCVYLYDLYYYVVRTVIAPQSTKQNTSNKMVVKNTQYTTIFKTNPIIKQLIEISTEFFSLYKPIDFRQAVYDSLRELTMKQSKTTFLITTTGTELLQITSSTIKIAIGKKNYASNRVTVSKSSTGVSMTFAKGSIFSIKSQLVIGFDGHCIYKIDKGMPVCTIGRVVYNQKDYTYTVEFTRYGIPGSLAIAKASLGETIDIEMLHVYTFLELLIVSYILYALSNKQIEYTDSGLDLPRCSLVAGQEVDILGCS